MHNQAAYKHIADKLDAHIEGQAEEPDAPFSLKQFALNGQSQNMRLKMLDDKYILGRVALLGQITIFYAEPGSGKTLLTIWMLIESIKSGAIRGEDVFYINSDDNQKGITEKLEIAAERYEFSMLSDGYNGFKNRDMLGYLDTLVTLDQAKGKIIILDTLKKFVEMMDKKAGSTAMEVLRRFTAKGGSVIGLSHVNKHRSEDGKLIFQGTTDVRDDCDCAYIIDRLARNGKTIVTFENCKSRGDVAEKAVYQFERDPNGGQSYADLLATVQPVDDDDLKRFKKGEQVEAMLSANSVIIRAVLEAIEAGIIKRTELVDEVQSQTGQSKNKVIKTMDRHTGTNWLDGHRWEVMKGEKNTKTYRAIEIFGKVWGGVKNMESMES